MNSVEFRSAPSLIIGLTLAFGLGGTDSAASAGEGLEFFSYKTHTHLKFPVDLDVTYAVETVKEQGHDSTLRITLKGAAHTKLARDVAQAVGSFVDDRTAQIVKKVDSQNVVFEVKLTDQAKKLGIEFFNYRNKSSSELLVDFWFAKTQEATAVAVTKKQAVMSPAIKKELTKKSESLRRVASTTTICPSALKQGEDLFLHYGVYHKPYDFSRKLSQKTADEGYEYTAVTSPAEEKEKSKTADDRTHYSLAQKLYQKKKYGLALRTIDFFEKSFHKSELAPEMAFLKANVQLKLSAEMKSERLKATALSGLTAIMQAEPTSNRGKFARLYILKETLAVGLPARVLELARAGAALKDDNEPLYLLAEAEALQQLSDLDAAEKAYRTVWALGTKTELSAEGAYRVGEILILKGNYEKAETDFVEALRAYPARVLEYPTAVFNLAEVYFRRENLKDSREMYLEFKNRFPNDKNLWAAELRIPEIDRLSGNVGQDVSARYEAVINRHPYSTGAYIAELRLSECALRGDEGNKLFFENFYKKLNVEAHYHPLISPVELKRLTDLAQIKFLNNNGDFESVLPFADRYRDKVTELNGSQSFISEFKRAATAAINAMITEGRFSEALSTDVRYGDYLGSPKPFGYQLRLLDALQKTNQVSAVATAITALQQRLSDASVAERDEFFAIEYRQQRLLKNDPHSLSAILQKISDDGALSHYKYSELALVAMELKDLKLAVEYDTRLLDDVTRSARLSPKQDLVARVRRVENLVSLRDYPTALSLAERLIFSKGALTEYVDLQSKVRELHATALFHTGAHKQALNAIEELLKFSPEEKGKYERRTEFEFLRAKCLDLLSRDKEAVDSYRKIATTDKGLWGKSAQAELDHKEFKIKDDK